MSFELHVPQTFQLPATVAADTEETWGWFKVHPDVGVMQLISAFVWNAATIADTTNFCTIDIYNNTTSVSMAQASFAAVTADVPLAMTISTTIANTKALPGAEIIIKKLDPGTGAAWTVPGSVSSWWILGGAKN